MRSIDVGELEDVDCWWTSAMMVVKRGRERWSCVMLGVRRGEER
jgi:hypothetical protein